MSGELRRARNRQMLIFLLVCAGMVGLLGRLYYWQIVRGGQLATLANAEHTQNLVLNAPRGLIYDAQGRILATNVVRDDVYIEPIQFKQDHAADTFQGELGKLVEALHQVLPTVSTATLYKDFELNAWTVRIASHIEPGQSQRLRALPLADTFLQPRSWRIYPQGASAAQVLGFVQQSDRSSIGAYGLERQYDALLAGKPGSFTAETDLNGNPLVVGSSVEQPAVPGANLTLTIDSTVEYMVEQGLASTVQQMKAASGSVVVLNARTGAVVAMAGAPGFDPNAYGSYAGSKGCLGKEEVFLNPVLYCEYEPGSTMKVVTMAAALDQELITPATSMYDPGVIFFPDADTVRNWEGLGYGQETMTQVLEHSANVGAAYVAHTILGPQRYYPYLANFGFGRPTGIDSKEEIGFYPTPGNAPGVWSVSDLTRQAFGQSILATPLQVAMAYQAIAHGGVMMRPYLVDSFNNNGHVVVTTPGVIRRVISARASALLTGMLEHVVTDGLAQPVRIPGYTIAAKTGTATTQGLAADQTEASVAGFIPASNPRFVILVKVDQPQAAIYGGTAAAPLWKSVAQELMEHYAVPPDVA
jgi:cell division protein FtsI/penicillin-binding protein 2